MGTPLDFLNALKKGTPGLLAEWLLGTDENGVATAYAPKAIMAGADGSPLLNNREVAALASAARTASVNSADLVNDNARGVRIVIDVTALALTPSVIFTVVGKDVLSGKYTAILTSAAITAVGTTTLIVYPGVTPAANLAVSHPLPRLWRLEAAHGDADSITYSVGVNYIL